MKKLFVLTLALLSLCSLSFAGDPWGHRYASGPGETNIQPWASLITNTPNPVVLLMSYEWGRGGWDGAEGAQVGVGPTTDGSSWTWTNLNWWQDGDGSNKRTMTDAAFATGTNYYAYRFKATDINAGEYRYASGSADWNDLSLNTTVASVASTSYMVIVVPEAGMIGLLTAGCGWLFWRKR